MTGLVRPEELKLRLRVHLREHQMTCSQLALVLKCSVRDLEVWLSFNRAPCARTLIAVEKWCDEQERVAP